MAVKRKKGLGKGLDSLIPSPTPQKQTEKEAEKPKTTARTTKTVKKAPPEAIKPDETVKINLMGPNPDQPRKQFDDDTISELAASIKQFGVLQPILVQKKGDFYEIIAGERRWRAAKEAGLKEVPVIIKEFTDQEVVEISLIENIQRENLNPIEEAKAYRRLMDEYHLKQDAIAQRVSKSRTAITNTMRLLKLDERVQEMVIKDELTAGHVRTLLSITDPEIQYTTAVSILTQSLSVRETEKLVKELLNPSIKKKGKEKPEKDAIYLKLEERMQHSLGTKVEIQRKGRHKGRIEIEYYNEEELERISDLLSNV